MLVLRGLQGLSGDAALVSVSVPKLKNAPLAELLYSWKIRLGKSGILSGRRLLARWHPWDSSSPQNGAFRMTSYWLFRPYGGTWLAFGCFGGRFDIDVPAAVAFVHELDYARDFAVEGGILAAANIYAWLNLCAALTHNDRAAVHQLAAECLHA